ncbi:hypothetical protein [Alteribacillus sp. YIM 98480]|uniref:hypothetical protein n=1 Tax=Alteribacillus sp. YIM 98480 TaxID=2606599 RepID=UPI00131D19BE|nr:hypothetical protein [Alteribacillus sp. YIM 98480]
MSSASAYSLEIPSVRQWKAKISFPYAAPLGLVDSEQGACAFLKKLIRLCIVDMILKERGGGKHLVIVFLSGKR